MANLIVLNNSGKPLVGVLVLAQSRDSELYQKGMTNKFGAVTFQDVACRTLISVRDHAGQSWLRLNEELRSLRGIQELTY